MVKVYSIDGVTPVVDPTAFVHPTAVLIGDVIIGPGTYIGPNACLRGDFGRIVVGARASIQDCCVMHGYPGRDTQVDDEGQVGHGAVVHSAYVGKSALVGMNAVVNDNAHVGDQSVVAAMAFVRAGMVIPPRTLVAGIPAKIVRELNDTELAWKRQGTALYNRLAERCLATLRETVALTAIEPNRRQLDVGQAHPLSELKKKAEG